MMQQHDQNARAVVFIPDRVLRNAIDPEYARWMNARMEPLLRVMREHARKRRIEQRRLHGRDHRIPQAVRRAVYQRDGGACVQCGAEVGLDEWRCHHVTRYPAGPESVENLTAVCLDCHEWLHDGFVDSPTARERLREFRRWWLNRRIGNA